MFMHAPWQVVGHANVQCPRAARQNVNIVGPFIHKTSLGTRTPGMREFLHHVGELREQVVRVVRAGRRFRVILHTEQRQILVAHAFVGMVVQIQVSHLYVAGWKRVGVDTKAVILRGNFNLAG